MGGERGSDGAASPRRAAAPALRAAAPALQLVSGADGTGGVNDDAGAGTAACFCPAAITEAPGAALGPLLPPLHALEQEMLRRTELQLHVAGGGGGGGGDRRRERKMKNRASAARSRARRLAYVNELEELVSFLQAENEELQKLCDELNETAAETMVVAPVTSRAPQLLRRTSSAPL